MKRFYIVFSAQLDGKNYAGTMVKVAGDNIMDISHQVSGMVAAHICASKKKQSGWPMNGMPGYKRNGTSIFG